MRRHGATAGAESCRAEANPVNPLDPTDPTDLADSSLDPKAKAPKPRNPQHQKPVP